MRPRPHTLSGPHPSSVPLGPDFNALLGPQAVSHPVDEIRLAEAMSCQADEDVCVRQHSADFGRRRTRPGTHKCTACQLE